MSNPTPATPAPLSMNKHLVITAALAALGTFLNAIIPALPPEAGAALGVVVSEILIYEHSA